MPGKHVLPFCLSLTLLALFLAPQLGQAQQNKIPAGFQGAWEGVRYLKDKTRARAGVDVNKSPCEQISLNLSQEGAILKGEYAVSLDWGRRFESGELESKIMDNIAELNLESGWRGKVKVRLTLRGGKLYWKIMQSEGENYFPLEMVLRRLK